MLEDGFYFSYTYDVTCSRQRRVKHIQDNSFEKELGKVAADKDYFWNYEMLQDFITNQIDPHWFTPLINGYVGEVHGTVGESKLQICLITRRMHHKSGSQKINRGINDEGFVANQCETEQILIVNQKTLFSHV